MTREGGSNGKWHAFLTTDLPFLFTWNSSEADKIPPLLCDSLELNMH